jgi:hypothetical protein
MTRRLVRFAPFFFDQLDDHFGEGRTAEGAPSATDFILFDLVTVRDKLGEDFEGCTVLVPPGLNVRVFIGSGALVGEFAIYAILADDGSVEVISIDF